MDVIGERFAEPLTIRDIAQRVGASTTAVKQAFSSIHGCSIHKYLCRVRVREAAKLLQITDMKVESIAIDVGFSNRKSLERNFAVTFGETPQQYRARLS
jgi:transcriptional regulator GlxA family with amidase domain